VVIIDLPLDEQRSNGRFKHSSVKELELFSLMKEKNIRR
jgi:hypothetical protein